MATSSSFEGEIYGSDDEKETKTVESNQTTTAVSTENVKPVELQEEKVDPKLDLKGTISKNNKEEIKFEYPMQKYLRLQKEVSNLEKQLKELTQLAESNKEESTKNTIAQVNEDLKRAWANIEQLKNNRHLTPLFGETQAPILGDVDSRYLQKRLQELQANTSTNKTNGDSTNAAQSVLTLYRDPATNDKSYQFKEISERLDALEKLVGPIPQHTSNTKGGMTRNIEYLGKRLELLSDQNRISALKKRADKLKDALKDIKSLTQNSTTTSTTTTTTSYGFSSWQPGQPLPGNVMNWKQGQAIPEGWRLGRKGFLKPAYNLPPHLSTWQQGQTIPEGYRLSKHGALKPAYLYNFGDNYSKFQQQPSYLPTTVQRF